MFSQDAISKTILLNSPFVRVFGQEEALKKLEESKMKEVDFSNNMYAACMMSPEKCAEIQKASMALNA